MNEVMHLLLTIDWVAIALFVSSVVILLFVLGFFSIFTSNDFRDFQRMHPPSVPDIIDHPSRRKNDRKDS